MEIKFFNPDGIPLKPGVHISFDPPTQGLIKEISEDKDTQLARLRRFAAEQQEVTWCCVQFGVKEAGRSGSRRPSRHWCFVPVH